MRRAFLVALAVSAALGLAACGGSGEQPSASGGQPPASGGQPAVPAVAKLSAEDQAMLDELGYITHHEVVMSDNLTWAFDEGTGTLTISGSGPMQDYTYDALPEWAVHAGEVRSVVLDGDITTVGDFAFDSFYSLTDVSLPDTVEYIGFSAFFNCYQLADIPFPAGLEEIAAFAFGECKVHKPLSIPEGVLIIGAQAFHANDFLYTIEIPASAYYISERAFSNSLHVAEFVVSPDNPFYTAEDGVLFDKGKTLLLHYPLFKESAEYAIPGTVTRIGEGAFDISFFLKKLIIPASVTEVGLDQFMLMRALETYEVDAANPALKVENGALLSKDGTMLYPYPKALAADEFVIPQGVETLPMRCFDESGLGRLVVPEGIRYVGANAFFMNGTDIYLPESFVDTVELIDFGALASADDTTYDMAAGVTLSRTSDGNGDLQYTSKARKHVTIHYAGDPAQWEAFVAERGLEFGDTRVVFE